MNNSTNLKPETNKGIDLLIQRAILTWGSHSEVCPDSMRANPNGVEKEGGRPMQ